MLILPIKKKWYDMILAGDKKEEYREIKPYWYRRFRKIFLFTRPGELSGMLTLPWGYDDKEIMFRNGYSKNSHACIARCTLSVGTGREEWGAERGRQYFILTIHEIIEEVELSVPI